MVISIIRGQFISICINFDLGDLMKHFCLLLIPLFFACASAAQKVSFGPTIGTYVPKKYGTNTLMDSIFSGTLSDAGDGERSIGFFFQYEVSKTLSASSELIYFTDYSVFEVFNFEKTCNFCPVYKVNVVSHNTVALIPTARLSLPFSQKAKASLIAGVSLNFQSRKSPSDYHDNRGRDAGVWETINHMDEMVKKVVPYYTIGGSVQFRRFILTGRYVKNFGNTIYNDIVVYDVPYKFYVQSKYVFITLSYDLAGQFGKKGRKAKRSGTWD